MLRVFSEREQEARMVKALTSKSHFSEWLKWEGAMAVDLHRKRLLQHQSDSYLISPSIASKILVAHRVCSSAGDKQVQETESALSVVVMLGL